MFRLTAHRFWSATRAGIGATALLTVAGCTAAEKPPATPPKLPPVPARPANSGSGGERYQQLMKNSPDGAKSVTPK